MRDDPNCTCDEMGEEEHSCPFQSDVNDDPTDCCTCCPFCEGNCADDI